MATGRADLLAGGPAAYLIARLVRIGAPDRLVPVAELGPEHDVRRAAVAAPRPAFAGTILDRPRIMGIVNVTPDSFSDGGACAEAEAAIAHGRRLRAAGADILDIGGESTRPEAVPVPPEEEMRRVLPVIRALVEDGATVSVDTRHAATMRSALAAGARIVNDVSALAGDPDSLAAVAESGAAVVLMHMQGEPRTMQRDPRYRDVLVDVHDFLAGRVAACLGAGIARERIAVDPGIGFGKTIAHNLRLLGGLALFLGLGCAVAVGVSRKGFLGRIGGEPEAGRRLPASLAAALAAADRGAHILRVHDVAETRQALAVRDALRRPDAAA